MDKQALINALSDIVGPEHVLSGKDVSARATHFWDASPMSAAAIVRPATTEQVSDILKLCHDNSQPVVTHGGVTGLVEGHRSTQNDIVLSLERMRAIGQVDVTGRTLTVQSGAILQNVQQVAADAGLQFGLDLGARGSCTIGGNISTNAGGLSVLRYGMAREQVLGLEVVLADGTILSSMNRMMKNNAGYDLKHLFIGSEGTLGLITQAVLRLRPATPVVETALLAFDRFEQVTATLNHLSATLNGTLDAFEVIWKPFYQLNTHPEIDGTSQSPLPRDYALYVIAESRSSAPHTDSTTNVNNANKPFEQALEQALSDELIVDAVIAQSERERANIWHIREHIDIAMRHDPLFVYDISLPIQEMQSYVDDIQQKLQAQWPDVILYVYGHLADGNLHVLVAPTGQPPGSRPDGSTTQTSAVTEVQIQTCIQSPSPHSGESASKLLDPAEHRRWHALSNEIVYLPLQSLGGSVSAEHGIGLSKKPYLALSRTVAEIRLMEALKKTLDPAGILNPGKIIH